MLNGLIDMPWWGYILVTLVMTHITIVAVTVYLHRCQAHRALDLHPAVSHFFRLWLWLTTGMVTKEWVAVHRKHHARVETEGDPHSPVVKGINKVLWQGAELYREEAGNAETLEQYGHETPDDWLERHVYDGHTYMGIVFMLLIDVLLFGPIGITIFAVQMAWIPLLAAGVINGIGHYHGYRNFEPADASTNIVPIGILIGGEELHNNHHAFASSARFSVKPWEFDIGWWYISILQKLGLARVKKLAPVPQIDNSKPEIDYDTVSAIITNRLHVMSDYASEVIADVYRDEVRKANVAGRRLLRKGRKLLHRADNLLDQRARDKLQDALAQSESLRTVYEYRQRLQAIWLEKTATREVLVQRLQEWCRQAEETGIEALQQFADQIRTYTLQPTAVRV